jgi:hypothetical protein
MNTHAEPRHFFVGVAAGLSRGWKPFLGFCCLGFMLWASPTPVVAASITQIRSDLEASRSEQAVLETRVKSLDVRLEELRATLRAERDQNYRSMHSAKRDINRQQFEVERIRQSLGLIEQQISLTRTDTERTIERYESLNPLKRSLEASAHAAKLQENAQRIGVLERDKQPLQEQLASAEQRLADLRSAVPANSDTQSSVDDDSQVLALLGQRDAEEQKLAALRQRVTAQKALLAAAEERKRQAERKRQSVQTASTGGNATPSAVSSQRRVIPDAPIVLEAPSAGVPAPKATWVFAITGDTKHDIESVLKLKSWVESYGGHYVQARWNGFGSSTREDTDQFRFEFAEKLRQIHPSARVVLIGHGRGGGAAIEAATDVAYTLGRPIDFLGVLDPVGVGNLRANIVYKTGDCKSPVETGEGAVKQYVDCLTQAPHRTITSNVRFFYNRWQKEGRGPDDFAPLYGIEDAAGDAVEVPSATGRFVLANNVASDQRRMFFNNDSNAHLTLLEEESRLLPNILVKYLR